MRSGDSLQRSLWSLGLGWVWLAAPVTAAPVLRSADVRITAATPSSIVGATGQVVKVAGTNFRASSLRNQA